MGNIQSRPEISGDIQNALKITANTGASIFIGGHYTL